MFSKPTWVLIINSVGWKLKIAKQRTTVFVWQPSLLLVVAFLFATAFQERVYINECKKKEPIQRRMFFFRRVLYFRLLRVWWKISHTIVLTTCSSDNEFDPAYTNRKIVHGCMLEVNIYLYIYNLQLWMVAIPSGRISHRALWLVAVENKRA